MGDDKTVLNECVVKITLEEWDVLLLFGFDGKAKNKYALNFMLTLARHAIWRRRNIMKQKKK